MTTLPAAGAVVKVTLEHSTGADLHAGSALFVSDTGGPPSSADCLALATAISGAWATYLAPYYCSFFGLQSVSVRDLSSASGAEATYAHQVPGTNASAPLPANVAVLINASIARRYRGGKPRVYIPLLAYDAYEAAGQFSGAAVAALQSHWNSFIAAVAALTSGSTTLTHSVNVSYFSNKTMRSTPVVDQILRWSVNPIPGTQRRRLRA